MASLTAIFASLKRDGKIVARQHLVLAARVDDRVATLERDFQRLFDNHVLAGIRRSHGRLLMRAARRADRHNVDGRIGQHLFDARSRPGSHLPRRTVLPTRGDVSVQAAIRAPRMCSIAFAWKLAIIPQPTMPKPIFMRSDPISPSHFNLAAFFLPARTMVPSSTFKHLLAGLDADFFVPAVDVRPALLDETNRLARRRAQLEST